MNIQKHVVVGIISREENDQRQYLLISSTKDFGEHTGFFYPPGGHLEEGENEQDALVREIQEELSINVYPTKKLAETPSDIPNQTTHWWECEAKDLNKIKVDTEEIKDVVWLSKQEILNQPKVWPATKEFFKTFI